MKDAKGHGSNPRGGSGAYDYPAIGQQAAHQQAVVQAVEKPHDAFLTGMTPMQAAKARDALESQVRLNGQEFVKRHELIERRVSEGAQLQDHKKFGRILMGTNGAFLDSRNATKTGLDYAAFLHKRPK